MNMITKEDIVHQIFPVPVLITKYPESFEEEFKFIQNLEYIETIEVDWTRRNLPSKDSYILRHKELSKIKDFIYESLDKFTTEILATKQKVVLTQSWCNQNPPNTEHPSHQHHNSIISGVFYFKQNSTLPSIQFKKVARYTFDFDTEDLNQYNSETFSLPLVDGELVLFPSNLVHAVPLNLGNDIRYSLSFNTFANELGSVAGLTQLKVLELDEKER